MTEIDYERNGRQAAQDEEHSLINLVNRYLSYWKWFVLSVALAVVLAFIYLRYQTPKYEVSASILIKDEKKGAGLSELSAFADLGLLPKSGNIDNEIELLKSRTLMTLVAKELRLNVQYFIQKSPVEEEHYSDSPVYLRFQSGDSTIYGKDAEFNLQVLSDRKFSLKDEDDNMIGEFAFGTPFASRLGQLLIFPTGDLKKENVIGKKIRIVISPLEKVVDDFRKIIKIDPVNKTSSVITISLKGAVKDKLEAIVNNLIRQHNADAVADKNEVSKNTAEFINERIRYITAELSTVEGEVEEFKTKHKLVDVESEAKLFLETGSASELGVLEANTQKALADYMFDYMVKHSSPGDLMPANLGLSDASVAAMIDEYNRLVLERNRIMRSSGEKNPVIENLTGQIESVRRSIKESLYNYQNALQIKIKELAKQEEQISSKIATVPKYERQYRMIQRQQQIKETLYLYLLQKREETNIALAVTVASVKVIDKAYSNSEPVSPKKKVILLIAILLGIALPVVILYVKTLLDTKVHGKRDIDKLGLPFLGDIPHSDSKSKIVVQKGENSSVAEAFRLLRTNVDFMLGPKESNIGKTIFLTSTLSKEGKSFIAMNLASSLAISGKRVLLIGLDIRAPKILQYFDMEERAGVTNYIMDPDLKLSDVILKARTIENLDLLPSGAIPPNPAELLMHDKVKEMFAQVKKQYDYVIVDTAPVGMVTDTLLLGEYADAFIYVVRAYYLDRRLLTVAEDLYRDKRFPNMAVLINGTDKEKGYGYGYGYGYGGYGYGHQKPRPMWKRAFSSK